MSLKTPNYFSYLIFSITCLLGIKYNNVFLQPSFSYVVLFKLLAVIFSAVEMLKIEFAVKQEKH